VFKPAQLVHRCIRAIKRLPWAPLGLGLVVLVVALEATFIMQAATEKGCGMCHVPSAARAEVTKGRHEGLHCLGCHRTTSGAWFLERNLRAARNLVTQIDPFGEPDLSRAFVPNDICVTCHKAQIAVARTTGPDVQMRHKDVVDARVPCQQCHARETHGVSRLSPQLDHSSCSPCHNGVAAGIACSVCHRHDPSRDPATLPGREALLHGPNGAGLHGMGRLDSCITCHARTFCASCHGVELPHDMNTFPHLHGTEAIRAGDACLRCHAQTFCDSCHSITMPHPEGFLAQHPATSKQTQQETCRRCHVPEDCTDCHASHTHSPLPAATLDEIRKSLR
jgi:hypothetical protein